LIFRRPTPITDSLWRRLRERLRPAPVATTGALQEFLRQRALFLAQKCAIDYCRGKTGLASYALFSEKTFLDALDICRWETFLAVLGDLLILTEGILRPHTASAPQSRLGEALIALHAAILADQPAPAHRAQGWGDATDAFAQRLMTASAGTPRQALKVADHSAKRLFETLPIHSSYRELDREVVYGAVRFRMIALSGEMHRRFAAPELVRQLLA
jgi:hypothetical protein